MKDIKYQQEAEKKTCRGDYPKARGIRFTVKNRIQGTDRFG